MSILGGFIGRLFHGFEVNELDIRLRHLVPLGKIGTLGSKL